MGRRCSGRKAGWERRRAQGRARRYARLQELASESRTNLRQLEVYRVKVDEEADLEALVERFSDGPRLKYIEPNGLVSVPQPVAGIRGRS